MIPDKAPASWERDKRPEDTPLDFIRRHYGPWLNKGLTRPHIRALDEKLHIALQNWLARRDLRTAIPSDMVRLLALKGTKGATNVAG